MLPMCYYTPNDFPAADDSAAIQQAVDAAAAQGLNRVVIPRRNERTGSDLWIIPRAIRLPDRMEIVLDNCTLRQADGVFEQVFRNANFDEDRTEQRDIRIRGVGHAVIDGGTPNGLTEKTSEKDGYPHIMANNAIFLHNVRNFSLENFTVANPRWWAVHLVFARNGHIADLTLDARANIPNQDGIDLRVGCRDIMIERIFGQSGDDLIALSGFMGYEQKLGLCVPGLPADICNVIIRDVVGTSVNRAVVALRNHDEIRLHDVTVERIYDTSGDGQNTHPYAVVRVGQKHYAQIRPSRLGETARIHIADVHAASGWAVHLNATLTDSRITGIYCGPGVRSAVHTGTDWPGVPGGVALRNVCIDHIYGDPERTGAEPLVYLAPETKEDRLENVCLQQINGGSVQCEYPTGWVQV